MSLEEASAREPRRSGLDSHGRDPLQSSTLDRAAASIEVTPMQVAPAWLPQRSPNILLIPGTPSVQHLRQNLKAAPLQLPAEMIAHRDSIGGDRDKGGKTSQARLAI